MYYITIFQHYYPHLCLVGSMWYIQLDGGVVIRLSRVQYHGVNGFQTVRRNAT
jgi:hypothetical protein